MLPVFYKYRVGNGIDDFFQIVKGPEVTLFQFFKLASHYPAFGDIFNCKRYHIPAFTTETAAIEHYYFMSYIRKCMLNCIVINHGIFRDKLREQHPYLWHVPLPVSQIIDTFPQRFFGHGLEDIIKTLIGRENYQV